MLDVAFFGTDISTNELGMAYLKDQGKKIVADCYEMVSKILFLTGFLVFPSFDYFKLVRNTYKLTTKIGKVRSFHRDYLKTMLYEYYTYSLSMFILCILIGR